MKANNYLFLLLLVGLGTISQGCLKDSCERKLTYTRIEPVYKTLQELHTGTAVVEAPRSFVNTGVLYYYDNKIFVNERSEGIHVIDNTDPKNPITTDFIAIPGNESFAVKNGIMYANSYIDLLAIDLNNYQLLGRTESVFPPLWEDLANNQVAVSYKETQVTEEVDCSTYNNFEFRNGGFIDFVGGGSAFDDNVSVLAEQSAGNGKAAGTGIGGSMSRFTIVGNYLYVVDQTSLDVFSLENAVQPTQASTVEIGWGIETIFPHEDKLFIGSNAGMFIFDNSNPTAPTLLSQFQHARACDPVFVSGDYAYVTLRSGTACEGFNNQLDLVDISNITAPFLVNTFAMENPHGLSINGNNLYVCEGDFGLKSFDITDPTTLDQHLLDTETGLHAFDAISLGGSESLLLVIGQDGLYQYNCENPADLKLLSIIPTK